MHVVIVKRVEHIGRVNDTNILQRHNPQAGDLETSKNDKKEHVRIVVGAHPAVDERWQLHTNNLTREKNTGIMTLGIVGIIYYDGISDDTKLNYIR